MRVNRGLCLGLMVSDSCVGLDGLVTWSIGLINDEDGVDGCAAALLPIHDSRTGSFSHDTARYPNIGAVGIQINARCVNMPALGGQGTGGYERAGK